MTRTGGLGSATTPLKPKEGLNGPPQVFLWVGAAGSFLTQVAAGKLAARDEKGDARARANDPTSYATLLVTLYPRPRCPAMDIAVSLWTVRLSGNY